MKYIDILEQTITADSVAKEQERKRQANQQIDDARRARTDATRKQQDTVRAANEKERKAKAKLSK